MSGGREGSRAGGPQFLVKKLPLFVLPPFDPEKGKIDRRYSEKER